MRDRIDHVVLGLLEGIFIQYWVVSCTIGIGDECALVSPMVVLVVVMPMLLTALKVTGHYTQEA